MVYVTIVKLSPKLHRGCLKFTCSAGCRPWILHRLSDQTGYAHSLQHDTPGIVLVANIPSFKHILKHYCKLKRLTVTKASGALKNFELAYVYQQNEYGIQTLSGPHATRQWQLGSAVSHTSYDDSTSLAESDEVLQNLHAWAHANIRCCTRTIILMYM